MTAITCRPYRVLADLPSYALTSAMRATAALGAEYCFGGVVDFYIGMGFETVCSRRMRRKEW